MTPEASPAVQDTYPEDFAHCYGCGPLNAQGLRIRSRWVGNEAVATFTPQPYHVSVPGFVYGGLLASLIDCHAMGTAAAAVEHAAGRRVGEAPAPRFVTAALRVDYLKPTPLGPELLLRGRATSVTERKVAVAVEVLVGDVVTVRGEAIAVRMPESMLKGITL